MVASGVASKYARALFAEARERGRLERVTADMDALRAIPAEDRAFMDFLLSPEVLTESKLAFVGAVFSARTDPLVANFLRLLVDKGRIGLLPEIAVAFRGLVEEEQGVLRARVESAVPLAADQETRLKQDLDRLTGKQVVLEKAVVPSVLGGVVVHLGNRIIDRSLRRGLERLAAHLRFVEQD
jgi:F-type H+-transporting ATPase subunit delta